MVERGGGGSRQASTSTWCLLGTFSNEELREAYLKLQQMSYGKPDRGDCTKIFGRCMFHAKVGILLLTVLRYLENALDFSLKLYILVKC
jgi:hypothetical protein